MLTVRTFVLGLGLLLCTPACSTDSIDSLDAGTQRDAAANTADAMPGAADGRAAAECSAQALELVNLVNEYRGENALPAIPASSSLCLVGDTHVGDLLSNAPDAPGSCNLHSWSDQGAWSACCYTSDHAEAQCMWDKPRELTVYPGDGFENAATGGSFITPAQALGLWKGSPGHNAVILNEGIWADQSWNAIGAGIENDYAMLWFGTAVDPAD